MKIQGFLIRQLSIPFVQPFNHSLSSFSKSDSIILEIHTRNGFIGFGECTSRAYVTGETTESTIRYLRQLLPQLIGMTFRDPEHLLAWLNSLDSPGSRFGGIPANARCAMELALLDALGKELNCTVLDLFTPSAQQYFFYSAVLPAVGETELRETLKEVNEGEFRQVKLKTNSDVEADLQRVDIIRDVLGTAVEIRIDVNGGWTYEQAIENIARFHKKGIRIIEQPLAAADRQRYPQLRRIAGCDICIVVDENVCTYQDAEWFIENEAASGFNLKIAKHGGILRTLHIYQLATSHGLLCQIGCHVGETSILTAAGMIAAAAAGYVAAMEGAFGQHLLEYDVCKQPVQFGHQGRGDIGQIAFQPGLGVSVDAEALQRATILSLGSSAFATAEVVA